jgi:DNA-binding beta-propeller fold protein YncE
MLEDGVEVGRSFGGDTTPGTQRRRVVDEATGALPGEIMGINGAHGVRLAPGTMHGFATSGNDGSVVMFDATRVVEIDEKALTVTRPWSTAPCKQPVAMAIDVAHHRLFSECRSGPMAMSDYGAGKVVGTVPIGAGVDGAAFDPASGDAFASNVDGTLTVIHQDDPGHYHVVET